ncbi:GtrA family protein [Phenylobacterium hankyongense]|uniref:GtrA family protein n=1 Tax=Phenylobacterium hankyongense TaxID=1813876 RepID=A0A328B4K4_9CAUL|nr:GtrA family protein [Phenylobacterium hankyongense]RAK60846.1 GtrA family protein [Phenylobacterium hankyongense]
MTAPILRQGATFAFVGLTATAVHVVTALSARSWLQASALEANLIGYGFAVLISYFGNARFTFGKAALRGGQFARFVAVSLFGLALNQAITFVAVNRLGLDFRLALGVVVVVVPAVSFVLSRLWAFRAAG